ncbi:LysR family transcriptional regulator [Polyangium jinanense]|uniref:LysR family transcriptional regulator n=1 Tax=Polyangium jinanense TaxID=2829994 RepID=A0A9X3WZ96_9BACT|nr:LysR substrate-binding domain-containing protein [Polyangium jinanense]MDC3981069.1 LysR family transcriptional regulator [Polyangium jinanense]
MELRHLRYFVAVAEAEHFGRAAERLHISQSPLSRQIAQLEEEIGAKLFIAKGRGVKLSPAGRSFLEGARATLARATRAVEDALEAAQGRIGTVVVGFEGGMAYSGLLPRVVQMFRARHPRVEVRLVPLPSEEQVAALRDGKISLGYGYHPPVENPLVHFRVLFRDRLSVGMSKSHRLATRRTLRIADLKNERFLWIPRKRSPRLYDDVIAAFRAHGQTLEIAHEEADNEALVTLVASGEGLSFFTESAAPFIRVGAVLKRVRGLDVVILGRSVWRAADEEDPLVRSFLEITNSEHSAREVSDDRQ